MSSARAERGTDQATTELGGIREENDRLRAAAREGDGQ
jgi:hypothetical protein